MYTDVRMSREAGCRERPVFRSPGECAGRWPAWCQRAGCRYTGPTRVCIPGEV